MSELHDKDFHFSTDTDLVQFGRATLEFSSHDQNRLQGTKSEIVVILLRQLLLGQAVQHRHLLGQHLSEDMAS